MVNKFYATFIGVVGFCFSSGTVADCSSPSFEPCTGSVNDTITIQGNVYQTTVKEADPEVTWGYYIVLVAPINDLEVRCNGIVCKNDPTALSGINCAKGESFTLINRGTSSASANADIEILKISSCTPWKTIISTTVIGSAAVIATVTAIVSYYAYKHGYLTCFRKEGMSAGVELGTIVPPFTLQPTLSNVVSSTAFQSTLSHVESSIAESVGHHDPVTTLQPIFSNV